MIIVQCTRCNKIIHREKNDMGTRIFSVCDTCMDKMRELCAIEYGKDERRKRT